MRLKAEGSKGVDASVGHGCGAHVIPSCRALFRPSSSFPSQLVSPPFSCRPHFPALLFSLPLCRFLATLSAYMPLRPHMNSLRMGEPGLLTNAKRKPRDVFSSPTVAQSHQAEVGTAGS